MLNTVHTHTNRHKYIYYRNTLAIMDHRTGSSVFWDRNKQSRATGVFRPANKSWLLVLRQDSNDSTFSDHCPPKTARPITPKITELYLGLFCSKWMPSLINLCVVSCNCQFCPAVWCVLFLLLFLWQSANVRRVFCWFSSHLADTTITVRGQRHTRETSAFVLCAAIIIFVQQ